jgi:hypothetical protein
MKIIGLNGAAGAGKDALAKQIIYRHGWAKYAFATPIRAALNGAFQIPYEDMEDPVLKNKPDYLFGRSIRYMMQTLGTEWGRELVNQEIWMLEAERRINSVRVRDMVQGIVITDCRFPNEADKIHEMGGIVVKITRTDNPFAAAVNANGATAHASEARLSAEKIDVNIYNTSSIEAMYDALVLARPDLFK